MYPETHVHVLVCGCAAAQLRGGPDRAGICLKPQTQRKNSSQYSSYFTTKQSKAHPTPPSEPPSCPNPTDRTPIRCSNRQPHHRAAEERLHNPTSRNPTPAPCTRRGAGCSARRGHAWRDDASRVLTCSGIGLEVQHPCASHAAKRAPGAFS